MLYDPKWEVPVEAKPIEPWRKLLLDAADYMESNGFCTGFLENCEGAVCARGALFRAAGHEPPRIWWASDKHDPVVLDADRRLSKFLKEDAAGFNNRQKTGEPVVAAMRACAKAE